MLNGRTNQGGSILVFTIVAVVLAAVAVGAIYAVREQGAQIRSDTPVFEAPTEAPEDSAEPANPEPEATPAPEVSDAPEEDSTPATVPGRSDAETRANDDTRPEDLPQTGPAETMLTLVAIAALAFVSYSYVQSQRATR